MPPKARARKAPARKAAPRKATTAPAKPAGGRPRKLEIDVNLQTAIVDAIEAGLTPERAAVAAGITERTHYRWQDAGREERERIEAGQKPRPTAAIFLAYVDAIDQATARAELGLVKDFRDGKVTALTLLERRFPDRWTARKPTTSAPTGSSAPATPLGQLEAKRLERERQRAK